MILTNFEKCLLQTATALSFIIFYVEVINLKTFLCLCAYYITHIVSVSFNLHKDQKDHKACLATILKHAP